MAEIKYCLEIYTNRLVRDTTGEKAVNCGIARRNGETIEWYGTIYMENLSDKLRIKDVGLVNGKQVYGVYTDGVISEFRSTLAKGVNLYRCIDDYLCKYVAFIDDRNDTLELYRVDKEKLYEQQLSVEEYNIEDLVKITNRVIDREDRDRFSEALVKAKGKFDNGESFQMCSVFGNKSEDIYSYTDSSMCMEVVGDNYKYVFQDVGNLLETIRPADLKDFEKEYLNNLWLIRRRMVGEVPACVGVYGVFDKYGNLIK